MRRDVFHAIADPTRREILHLLSSNDLNVNRLADNFEMSRPAVSQQVKILVECGLIKIRQEGRERFCVARLEKLKTAFSWLKHYEAFWSMKLDHLEDFLLKETLQETKKHKHGKIKKPKR